MEYFECHYTNDSVRRITYVTIIHSHAVPINGPGIFYLAYDAMPAGDFQHPDGGVGPVTPSTFLAFYFHFSVKSDETGVVTLDGTNQLNWKLYDPVDDNIPLAHYRASHVGIFRTI